MHTQHTLLAQQISTDVLLEKYAKEDEKTADEIFQRVAIGIAAAELTEELREFWRNKFLENMRRGAYGAGRIMSAAGTGIAATLANCFTLAVGDTITGTDKNGLPGIYDTLTDATVTLRRGGGVGYNFSPIRPRGAYVAGTHSTASGPCSYMDVYDKSCETVESAGLRRGAQLAGLNIDHPDIVEFIEAKRTKGRWNNFNISVVVSDAFMRAVDGDTQWELVHEAVPTAVSDAQYQRVDGMWVYEVVRARDLWDRIMKNAYDFAEPGILFVDTINRENNLHYCEHINVTNPCVTGDTRLYTSRGMVRVDELYKTQEKLQVTVDNRTLEEPTGFGTSVRPAVPVFKTAESAKVFEVKTKDGHSIKATEWHKFYTQRGKLQLKDLVPGDKLWLQSEEGQFGTEGSYELGLVMGYMARDGYFTEGNPNSVNDHEIRAAMDFWQRKEGVAREILNAVVELVKDEPANTLEYPLDLYSSSTHDMVTLKSVRLARVLDRFGFNAGAKTQVPEVVWKGTRDCVIGYLHGLFEADATVNVNHENSHCRIVLCSVAPTHLREVQQLLDNFGLRSNVLLREPAQMKRLPDGRGGYKLYQCKDYYELHIGSASRDRYMEVIGFKLAHHTDRYNGWAAGRQKLQKEIRCSSPIESIEYAGECTVYDTTQDDGHSLVFNGIATGNCGEQPLPPGACCTLGPIDLTRFVQNPFTSSALFQYSDFAAAVGTQVRFLDNVLDVTLWPLAQQAEQARLKRRIGIGFLGLGDTLIMLGLKYNSDEGRAVASGISSAMRGAAYQASIELAKERGAFPLFDAEKYLASGFAKRLPESIRTEIRQHGIRNSHLLSIAPTGTTSLAFADNASGGIEPAFSWAYNRRKRNSEGGWDNYAVIDHALRVFVDLQPEHAREPLTKAICNGDTTFEVSGNGITVEENVAEYLGPEFVSALEISAADHLAMMMAVQPYMCTSLSKCVVAGTRIMTNQGLIKVEDLGLASDPDTFAAPIDDLQVVCPDGKWRKVTKHYYGGVRQTIRVRLNNGQVIEGSEVHKLMRTDGWTQMSELAIGDWIQVRRSINYDVLPGGQMLEPAAFWPNAKSFRTPERMSPDLAMFLGMLCADGHLQETSGLISLTKNHLPTGEKFTQLADSLFGATIKHTVDPRNGVNYWSFTSRALLRWIRDMIGYRSHDKHAPEAVMRGSQEEMLSFLTGVSLDGYKTVAASRENTVVYMGRSRELAENCFSLLNALGYLPRMHTKAVIGYNYNVYGAACSGFQHCMEERKNSAFSEPNEYVAVPPGMKRSDYVSHSSEYYYIRTIEDRSTVVTQEQAVRKHAPHLTVENDPFIYKKVISIEYDQAHVYDIEVEESHDYLIDGVVSHNTVNIPADYPYEDFKDLYMDAWKGGLKGIATYRPNATLGSILSVPTKVEEPKLVPSAPITAAVPIVLPKKRPVGSLSGITRRVEYHDTGFEKISFMISVNYHKAMQAGTVIRTPIEFIYTAMEVTDKHQYLISTMVLLSKHARTGADMKEVLRDLKTINMGHSIRYGEFVTSDGSTKPRFHPSDISLVAYVLLEMIDEIESKNVEVSGLPELVEEVVATPPAPVVEPVAAERAPTKRCPECGNAHGTYHRRDGCWICDPAVKDPVTGTSGCGYVGSCG